MRSYLKKKRGKEHTNVPSSADRRGDAFPGRHPEKKGLDSSVRSVLERERSPRVLVRVDGKEESGRDDDTSGRAVFLAKKGNKPIRE